MARILVVSNRLPITVERGEQGLSVERSSGGLATGLKSVHQESGGLWLGWPGFPGELSGAEKAELERQCSALRVVPISLSAEELTGYYEGYCNGLLWPLFHSFPSQLPLEGGDFDLYQRVNERFADAVARVWQEGDLIWVHDYQLMLVPGLLRKRLPQARIGFFLHIPFPPADTFRTLPARQELLESLLAADLIGFHTASYMRNFAESALHVLGVGLEVNALSWQGRVANVGIFPMGVDAKHYQQLAESDEVKALIGTFRGGAPERLLVGIDRLDYTKGIPRRLLAYERLLADHPELHRQVRLVQVAVPSRTQVDAYADFRAQVDRLVGRINGRFGSPDWAPLHYIYRQLSDPEVVALYRAADAMLVTPLRDGMNLVAKEFVASRSDGDGVLVLSEFAGAASELGEAVRVNPYDVARTAQAIHRALTMGEPERRARMATLRERVMTYDVYRWAQSYVEALQACASRADHRSLAFATGPQVQAALEAMRGAKALTLALDYDGTLVSIVDLPQLAVPDPALLKLLERLAQRPHTRVHVISGRGRDVLERWLGKLPVALHAEHGQWSRTAGGQWTGRDVPTDSWRAKALEIFEDFAERTPGSLVEQKRSALAWHYRLADAEYGPLQANELKAHLVSVLSNEPVEVLSGDKVVELRPFGANKGKVGAELLQAAAPGMLIAAFGDDRTDEDLFRSLPPPCLTVHVGPNPSAARLRLPTVEAVRALLLGLLD